jgi:diguanylate cyclase (GGDEF)-like protein
MPKKKSLRKRLTLMILLLALMLGVLSVTVGYSMFSASMKQYYVDQGRAMARLAADIVDAESVDTYLSALTKDAAYDETLRLIRMVKNESSALYMYVIKPVPEDNGVLFLYDTDESGEQLDLGEFDSWEAGYEKTADQINGGGPVDPVISTAQWGWILTVYEPVYGADGETKAYVGVDYEMLRLRGEQTRYLLNTIATTVAVTLVFVSLYMYIIRKSILNPLRVLTRAADDFLVKDTVSEMEAEMSGISSMAISTNDELQRLSEAMKSMEQKIYKYLRNLNSVTVKAETDSLTGLWNRETFQQRVTRHLCGERERDGQSVDAFIMLDVDHFKSVNDLYGHTAGDSVLRECARAMARVMRESDIVARQGGDEFVVFCPGIGGAENAAQKARQIHTAWSGIFPGEGVGCVTASIGVALAPKDGRTFQELYANADKALYKAKEQGRNRFVLFSDEA